MANYYALLRGGNVSGKNKIKMKEFISFLAEYGVRNVTYYIQSVNSMFENHLSSKVIKDIIKDKYGYNIEVLIYSRSELEEIRNENPFLDEKRDTKKIYYAFLSKEVNGEDVKKLMEFDIGDDRFHIKNKVIYVYYNTSAGKSKLNNSLIERKLKISSTMRNHNTVNKLIEEH